MDRAQTIATDGLLNTDQAAAKLGIKAQTLRIWRIQRNNPLPFIKLGKSVRYDPSDLDAFIERNRRTSTLDD